LSQVKKQAMRKEVEINSAVVNSSSYKKNEDTLKLRTSHTHTQLPVNFTWLITE
jgi:hypothetical protein